MPIPTTTPAADWRALGNDTNELDAQNILDIFKGQHLPLVDAGRVVTGDEQVLFDRFHALDSALGFAGQHAQDTV